MGFPKSLFKFLFAITLNLQARANKLFCAYTCHVIP